MNLGITDFIGYIIGLISIIMSVVFYRRSQRKHRERLARLLDPHVIHQDLIRCRDKIASGSGLRRIIDRPDEGIEDLAILQQTIQNVQKYVLVVRSRTMSSTTHCLHKHLIILKMELEKRELLYLTRLLCCLQLKQEC